MDDLEQVKRLLAGVDGWNQWREEYPWVKINLEGAHLVQANLVRANLREANLWMADLSGANIGEADLSEAYLRGASFRGADLRRAGIWRANLSQANLQGADLRHGNLERTDLNRAHLQGADLGKVSIGGTILDCIDLSETKGLDDVRHNNPSTIGIDTLQLSKGKIPGKFLRGCGLSDWEIESAKLYQTGLQAREVKKTVYRIYDLRANQAVQINPLFISYSHADGTFVDEMEKHLDKKGIRFWRDIHDAMAGRLEKVVDLAMQLNPTVLLVLSEHSVKSDWVEHEARTARELEKELGRDVLCPVALDGAWKTCDWPAVLREQIIDYNILDFSGWEDEKEMGRMFRRMVDGLDLFYKE